MRDSCPNEKQKQAEKKNSTSHNILPTDIQQKLDEKQDFVQMMHNKVVISTYLHLALGLLHQ